MTTVITTKSGKAMIKDAAIKVTIDHLSHIGPRKSILLGKTVIVDLLKLKCSNIMHVICCTEDKEIVKRLNFYKRKARPPPKMKDSS